jgi:hypothetical protein
LHGAAEHVQREHGAGQEQPIAVDALELLDRDALAARNPHQVGEQQVDVTHLRATAEPGTRLLEVRELRHGNPVV